MKKVFIDGKEGTTGLKIFLRIKMREDLILLEIPEDKRKDVDFRKKLINESDVTFLCLPDDAAKESVSLLENPDTIIIDASTAHRTNPDWVYGFPEIIGYEKIKSSKKIAVPGCHASGFVSLVYPLIKGGLINPDYPFVCHSETGYSGGGKSLIAEYNNPNRDKGFCSAVQYALGQNHKHQPEMKYVCNLTRTPIFNPTLGDYYSGMLVSVPLYTDLMAKKSNVDSLYQYYADFYKGKKIISVEKYDKNRLPANMLEGKDSMFIAISGNEERILLAAVFDNLGKGASGAAVQCMNIALGIEESLSLII